MASIFSKIVAGEIPCYKVTETENCLAFLDIQPLQMGHTLVIPKKEVDNLFDLHPDLYHELMFLVKTVAERINEVITCKKVGLAVIGLEVPHAHVHLVPIESMSDMNFNKKMLHVGHEELLSMREKLSFDLV
jgi:histidine triad (HIT) family protein